MDPNAFSLLAAAVVLLVNAGVSQFIAVRASNSAQRREDKKTEIDDLRTKQTATEDARKSLEESFNKEITRLNRALDRRDEDLIARRKQVEKLSDDLIITRSEQVVAARSLAEHKLLCEQMKSDLIERIEMLKVSLNATTAVAAAAQVTAAAPAALTLPLPPVQPGTAVRVEVVNSPDAPVPVTSGPQADGGGKSP